MSGAAVSSEDAESLEDEKALEDLWGNNVGCRGRHTWFGLHNDVDD